MARTAEQIAAIFGVAVAKMSGYRSDKHKKGKVSGMGGAVRKRVEEAPEGTWFRPGDFGGGNAEEQALSRLARDPGSPVVRAAKGLYFKGGQPDLFFGKAAPSPVDTAAQVCRGLGVGPAGAGAAAYLGLTTQVPPVPSLAVAGTPPQGVRGVRWVVRKNPQRAQLNFAEVAVVEVLSLFPSGVEADWAEVVNRVSELRAKRRVSLDRLARAVACERRKPELRRNFERLTSDLALVA